MKDQAKDGTEFLKKRMRELAAESAASSTYRFTDFLRPEEAALGFAAAREAFGGTARYPSGVAAYGGADGCERVMLRFGDPAECGYDAPFPIAAVHAETPEEKFSDVLTHRDYLGALMNLGIRRDTVGDIWIRGGHAWIFVEEQMAGHVTENLTRVKHTAVRCTVCGEVPPEAMPKKEPVSVITPSERLDAVLSKLLHLSRGRAKELFSRHEVFVNGTECASESRIPKDGDVIAVRGYGKYIYRGETGRTKKGSLIVALEKYL